MSSNGRYGGQTMTANLRRVLVCPPGTAGWNDGARAKRWSDLSYLRHPDGSAAESQHNELRRLLTESGAEVIDLKGEKDLSLDAVYAHDASLISDHGIILMRMGKPARAGEPGRQSDLFRSLDIPILGAVEEPGTVEAGDVVWLDQETLLVGIGYRTNRPAVEQMRALLAPHGVEVIESHLPHGQGPAVCLHLMSLMSMLDERTILVDLPWLSVPTVQMLREKDFSFVEIDPSERDTLACNVLSLGSGRLIAIRENEKTNRRLSKSGFELRTFPGSELSHNGGGGPTCLTRPLLRD